MREYNFLDHIIGQFDAGLRTVAAVAKAERPNPAAALTENPMSDDELRRSAGFMRINHTGEVCAQALYRGQLIAAKKPAVREFLQHAAVEETDHLAWCQDRLHELGSHTSYLNPVWYGMALSLGVIASYCGDALSLGFVEETEVQVGAHLSDHLERLAEQDQKSRAIVHQMREDEVGHADAAQRYGAKPLPAIVQNAMKFMADLMKVVAYRI